MILSIMLLRIIAKLSCMGDQAILAVKAIQPIICALDYVSWGLFRKRRVDGPWKPP